MESFKETWYEPEKGIIDPKFFRDDQVQVGTKSIKDDSISQSLDEKDITEIDDVI